jgi:hypothetical protein
MLQEKKISSKINYDVLKSLKAMGGPASLATEEEQRELGMCLKSDPTIDAEADDTDARSSEPIVESFRRPLGRAYVYFKNRSKSQGKRFNCVAL